MTFVRTVKSMKCRKIFAAGIACVLVLPALFACVISANAGAQQMPCCTGLSCSPSHQNETCVSKAGQADNWKSAPEARVRIIVVAAAIDSTLAPSISYASDDDS